MVARILVAVLPSLAVAPVLQADCLSDYCESRRLLGAGLFQWAKDMPGNSEALATAELYREGNDDGVCENLAAVTWGWPDTRDLMLVEAQMRLVKKYGDVEQWGWGEDNFVSRRDAGQGLASVR